MVQANPRRTEVAVGLVLRHIARGESVDAIGVANDVLNARPEDIRFAENVADMFARSDRWRDATEFYAAAWQRSSDTTLAVKYINALLLQEPPRITEANEVLTQARELGIDVDRNLPLLVWRATIEARRGNLDLARESMVRAYGLALETPGQLVFWRTRLGAIFGAREYARTVAFLDDLRRRRTLEGMQARSEEDQWLDVLRFISLLEAADRETSEGALNDLRAAVSSMTAEDPARQAYRVLGDTLYYAGRYEDAAAVWGEGAARFPNDWQFLNNRAYSLAHHLGRAQEALPLAERAAELQQQRPEAFSTLARVQIELGMLDDAEQSIRRATTFVDGPYAMMIVSINRARLGIARGDRAEAERWLDMITTISLSSADLRDRFEEEVASVRALFEQLGAAAPLRGNAAPRAA